VADTRPEGTLARTHEGKPGLPRGRNGLPLDAVRESQRERLLRSVIAAVAETGYPVVTVADIVRRARGVTRGVPRALRGQGGLPADRNPEWPAVPREAYFALAGAGDELIRSVVRTGQTDALPGLEETIVSLRLAVLAARPWNA
jgi:hypothetical protein